MEFTTLPHRLGNLIVKEEGFKDQYNEIEQAIGSITEDEIIETHRERYSKQKSISKAINHLLKERLMNLGWEAETAIFQHPDYEAKKGKYRIDFAKQNISMEVAFNNDGYTAWNLLKPTLASQLNHVKKAIQTKMGIVVMITKEMKQKGGFDSTVCTMENTKKYLAIMESQLTVPLLIMGLKPPSSFIVEHIEVNGKKRAKIKRI